MVMNNALFNTLTKVAAEAIPVTVAPSVNPGVVKSLVEAGKANGEVIPQVTGKGTIGNEEAGVAKTASEQFDELVKIASGTIKNFVRNVSGKNLAHAKNNLDKANREEVNGILGALNHQSKLIDESHKFPYGSPERSAYKKAKEANRQEIKDLSNGKLTSKAQMSVNRAQANTDKARKQLAVGAGATAGLAGAGVAAGKALENSKDKKQEKTASEQLPQELLQEIKQKEIEYSKAKEDYGHNIINGQINGAVRGGVGGGILGAAAGAIDPKVVHGKSRPAAALLAGLGAGGLGMAGGASIGGIKAALAHNQFGLSDKRRAITEAEDQYYNALADKNAHEELFDTLTKTAKVNFGQTIKNVATSAKDKLKMPDIKKPEVKAAAGGAAVGTAVGAGVGATAANATNKKEEKLASEDSMSGLFKEAAHVILESPFPETKTIVDPINNIKF